MYKRQGKEVERAARPVKILSLVVTRIELPRVWMQVSCSKGTYIRTLCSDIGEKLGCGGCMEALVRTQVERFVKEEAMTLDEIETARDEGILTEKIVPIEEMFSAYPAAAVIPEADSLEMCIRDRVREVFKLAVTCALCVSAVCFVPVSYTHLPDCRVFFSY